MCSLEAHELNLEKASHLWREFKSIPGAKFAKNKGFLKTSCRIIYKGSLQVVHFTINFIKKTAINSIFVFFSISLT